MSERKTLSPAEQADLYDLFEALVGFVGEKDISMDVIMHALCRTLAYGGVQMTHYDKVSKRQFVAMVVESVSAHYEILSKALDESGEHDD